MSPEAIRTATAPGRRTPAAGTGAPAVRAGAPMIRLPAGWRRVVLLTHIVAALGWFGADVVLGVLTFTAFLSDDPRTVGSAYVALSVFAVPVLLTFGLTALATGATLGLTSRWGLVRYWWVAVKLTVNLVLSSLVPILLLPRVREAAAQSLHPDASLTQRLGRIPTDLLFPPVVSGAALLFAAVLAVWKPWGPTPFGRRRSARAGAVRAGGA